MEVFKEINSLRKYLSEHRCRQKSIGLIPTMGALHEGHLSLLEQSLRENDISVCSIYVNPTQFNNPEDLVNYPRQEKGDLQLLKQAGCDAVFMPENEEMYRAQPVLTINFGELENVLEGKYRPGHFNGVALVVSKLLNAVQPDRAYFGQKDLQQFLIINKLVEDLGFPVDLRCVPILRENSGLAMSSRNLRLSEKERAEASFIYKMLGQAAEQIKVGKSWEVVQRDGMHYLRENKLEPEYFELVDAQTMQPLTNDFNGKKVALCVAAYKSNVRLIDNLIIEG